MPQRIRVGDRMPFFLYDTPYSARNRSRELLRRSAPLVLVFMSNFGHPITRTFSQRYAQTFHALTSGGFALVVRSRPDRLAGSIGPDTLPYPLLCDAQGKLYDYLQIPQRSGALMSYSLEAWSILRAARRQGYQPPRDALQQLPLTLILDQAGTVLFCHYGASLTDVPEDCAAMQQLLYTLGLAPGAPAPDDSFFEEELPLEEEAPAAGVLTGDMPPEPPKDVTRNLLQDPADTFSLQLPLEDLAPELPARYLDPLGDTGDIPLPAAPAAPRAPAPPPEPPASQPAPGSRAPLRRRPVTRPRQP